MIYTTKHLQQVILITYCEQRVDLPNKKSSIFLALNNTLHPMDIIDIYRTFHPKEAKYTFFSKAHRSFS